MLAASACSADPNCSIDEDCFAGEICRGDVCEKGERDTTDSPNNEDPNNADPNNADPNNANPNNADPNNADPNNANPNNADPNNSNPNNANPNNDDERTFVDLAAGEVFTCALDSDAQLWCWGRNTDGQLSIDPSIVTASSPQRVMGIDDVTAIAAAREHRCALRADGTVWCWGRDYGITDGSSVMSIVSTPTEMPISDIVQLEMGGYSACALESDRRSLSCWGLTIANNPPLFDEDVQDFAVGDDHACAVLASGAVRCWGSSSYDAVATGDPVQGIEGATQIAAGERHTCAIADGDVYCWGWNNEGQCGRPPVDFQEKFEMPQQVEGVSDATEIYAGSTYSCALHDSDRLTCWGGLLGHESHVYTDLLIVGPTQLFGLGRGVTSATAGFIHGCAAKGADLYCWGDNSDRQLAQEGDSFRHEKPARVQFPE